jgi:hypothetical protein
MIGRVILITDAGSRIVRETPPEPVCVRPDVATVHEFHEREGQRLADGSVIARGRTPHSSCRKKPGAGSSAISISATKGRAGLNAESAPVQSLAASQHTLNLTSDLMTLASLATINLRLQLSSRRWADNLSWSLAGSEWRTSNR